jgi:hypothetical protein
MGMRSRMDWTVNPIARLSLGRASPMVAKTAGDAMDCYVIANTSPKKRNGQEGLIK